MNKRATERIFGLCFALVLAAVFLFTLIMPDKSFSDEENRVLQDSPEFSISSYMEGRYENKMENYANDQFLFRNVFIKIKAAADTTFGKLEANGVYRGRDQYLMEDISVPDTESFNRTVQALTKFKKSHKGMPMHFLLAPNAANILEDNLPAFVTVADQDKYMDDFFTSIKKAGIKPIDVRKTFEKAADNDKTQLYYRTDHHWTTDGAFLAYKKAAKIMHLKDNVTYDRYVVKNDFRGTLASKSGFVNGKNDSIILYMPTKDKDFHNSVIYYSDSKKKTTEFYQLDNLDKKDAYTVFGGSNHPLYTIKTPMKSKEKLLLLKDSYANSFIPFLSQNFREIVIVDPRYYFGNIDDIIKKEGITQVMFLYNANTFFTDNSLQMMLGD